MVTSLELRYASLDSRHHHFACIPDPWHYKMLARIPSVLKAYQEGRVIQSVGDAEIHGGECLLVWYSFDALGQPLQEWGFDAPQAPQ
jgi:hypothetical protein